MIDSLPQYRAPQTDGNVCKQVVFARCKDAALLYVAGARRLGLDVCPALISTMHGPLLAEFLPSATVFNHCIVRLRLDRRSFWLDPTQRAHFGDLDVVTQPFDGLRIAQGVDALEPRNERRRGSNWVPDATLPRSIGEPSPTGFGSLTSCGRV